jgi:hypothetical protein
MTQLPAEQGFEEEIYLDPGLFISALVFSQ